MHIRERNGNLSLERPVYTAAVRDGAGSITQAARRSTLYLGSVSKYRQFSAVPRDLLDKLKDDEREQLRKALEPNEPKPDAVLTRLPGELARAGQELTRLAQADPNREAQAQLKQQLKTVEAAWAGFLRDAQAAGLRRVVRRKPAALPPSQPALAATPAAPAPQE